MAWLKRLFGQSKPQANSGQAATQNRNAQTTQTRAAQPDPAASRAAQPASTNNQQSVPPERMGLNGEYDQSGLAKRVALAFDETPGMDDIDTLYVAQTGTTVVLKGKAPDQQTLSKLASVAKGVRGATSVDTSQVTIG